MKMWQHRLILGLCLWLVLPSSLPALDREERELLELVRTGHGAALQSIHTFSCRYTCREINPEGLYESVVDYQRSLDAIRVRTRARLPHNVENVVDILVQNGRLVEVTKQTPPGKPPMVSGSIHAKLFISGDVWWMALLRFFTYSGNNAVLVTFDELLAKPHELRKVKRVNEGGRELIYVDLTHAQMRDELWFDPRVNYLVRKQVRHTTAFRGGKKIRAETEVVRFREVDPGIHFPEQIDGRWYTEGQPDGSALRTFSDIRVNQVLPRDAFQFSFPPNIKVGDSIQNKVFEVAADGRLIHLKDWKLLPLSEGKPLARARDYHPVTQEEPKSATRWILPTALLFLGLGGSGLLWHRWRKRAAFSS